MADSSDSASLESKVVSYARVLYPWHLAFFIGINGLLTALNMWMGKTWWALWPLVITGGLFILHYLIYRTSLVDDTWVEERASDLYDRSYDQGHIDSIAERHNMETTAQRLEREMNERARLRASRARKSDAKEQGSDI